jgi:hypothetical protein
VIRTDFAEDDDKSPKKGKFSWKGWEDRVAYDPEFPFKVFLEQVRHSRRCCYCCTSQRCAAVRSCSEAAQLRLA